VLGRIFLFDEARSDAVHMHWEVAMFKSPLHKEQNRCLARMIEACADAQGLHFGVGEQLRGV
jgi:hypothetical protein